MQKIEAMSIWTTELLRLWRSKRLVALIGAFLFFGFLGPIFARYAADIISTSTNNSQIQIIVAAPNPIDGIVGYTSNALQIGLMIGIAVTVSACAIDANYALSIFYRTRHPRMVTLLIPRLTVSVAATWVAYTLGLLAAWYETAVLIGPVDLGGLGRVWIAGLLNMTAYIAIAFLLTSFLRSIGTVITIAIVLVLASSILTGWPSVVAWSPVAFIDQMRIYEADVNLWKPAIASIVIAVFAIVVGCITASDDNLRVSGQPGRMHV